MIPILLWWKLPTFLDHTVPAIIGTVLMDFRAHIWGMFELRGILL
jgi:hypothetical protein